MDTTKDSEATEDRSIREENLSQNNKLFSTEPGSAADRDQDWFREEETWIAALTLTVNQY